MISKLIAISSFILIAGIAFTGFCQEIERNPKEAYFDVGKGNYIKEWLVIGPFPRELETDFLQAQEGEANIHPYEGMMATAPDGKTYTWKRYQSESDFIDLQDAMKQLLFSIEPRFQSELDDANDHPSTELRQAFEKNGIFLSQNAIIIMDRKGDNRWTIVDKGVQQEYLIVKAEKTLNIYHQPKNVMAYAACNLLSPKAQRLEMVLGRYNNVKVWLNGALVHENRVEKRWEDERFELPLKKGVNRCLIKVGQYVAGKDVRWGFWAKVEDYDAYLRSLQLKLTVQRHKPDVLTISAHRAPVSTLFKLPSLPVKIELRNEASQLLTTLQTRMGEPVDWAVTADLPDVDWAATATLQGTLRIAAKYTDASGKMHEAKFSCQAHNIVSATPKQGQWKTYDAIDGLIGICRAIVPDSRGGLWFGANGMGVQRYDGQTFETFTTADGLPSNHIFTIFEDSQGMMWFGTKTFGTKEGGAGVCRYDGERFETFTTKAGLIDDGVMAIYEDDKGHLWFGTSKGVSEFDGTIFRNYTPVSNVSSNAGENLVGAIAQDTDGNLWFGHGIKNWLLRYGGTTRYDGKSFTHFKKPEGLAQNWVTAITTDAMGNVWFGTSEGVSRYDEKTFVTFTTDDGLLSNGINEIIHTKNGDLWFATWEGVSRYRDGKFENFTTQDGLVSNRVYSIVADREGNLWCGTRGGASRYDGSVESIPAEIGGSGIQDGVGNLWFPISNIGLGRYDGKHIQTFAIEDGLPSNHIRRIYEDKAGNLWIGTFLNGLVKYDGKTFETFTTKDGLAYNNIEAIYEDRDGLLWVAMQGVGIFTYNGEKFVGAVSWHDLGIRVHSDLLYPRDIIEDRDGNLWFAADEGVTRYDGKTFTQFTPADGLPHHRGKRFLVDRQGDLWIATAAGLCRYDGKEFQTVTTQDSSVGNNVSCVFEDSGGNLWFGIYAGGVRKFDRKNFQQLTTDDGLLNNTVYSIHENEKGQMIFLTAGGITNYMPPQEKVPPPISVTEVVADKIYSSSVDFRSLQDFGSLRIPSTTSRINFAYHGVSFKTKRMRYNYMLEGYDTDWQATWEEEASYDNLKPGDYTFKVIAINRDLVYSETPATVHLKIVTPFYLRASFLAPIIGFGVILIVGFTILSIGYLKRRRQVQAYQQAAVEELQDARQVQMGLMPDVAPPIEGVEIAGKCLSANDVSGDFFDYLPTETPNEVVLIVADVTGKAMKGAMNAVLTDGILRATAREQVKFTPASLMVTLNDVLKGSMEWGMNVTMVIAMINADPNSAKNNARLRLSGESVYTLTLANAAHHAHPLLRRDGEVHTLKAGGLPLGMRAGAEYTEEQFPLHSGDVLVLMTDGIIEAEDSEGSMYSDSGRLEDTIKKFTLEQSAESMVDAIINDAIDFGGGKAQRGDDMTVVVAKIQ